MSKINKIYINGDTLEIPNIVYIGEYDYLMLTTKQPDTLYVTQNSFADSVKVALRKSMLKNGFITSINATKAFDNSTIDETAMNHAVDIAQGWNTWVDNGADPDQAPWLNYAYADDTSLKYFPIVELPDTITRINRFNSQRSVGTSLEYIDISNWDLSNVIDISYMFQLSRYLKICACDGIDTSNIENFYNCFENTSLAKLDFSNFDFYGAIELGGFCSNPRTNRTYSNIDKINLKNVLSISSLFSQHKNRNYLSTTLDVSMWDVQSIIVMNNLFYNTFGNINEINAGGWDTSNVLRFDRLFGGNSNLQVINISNWNFANAENVQYMFDGLTSLVAIIGPVYNIRKSIGLPLSSLLTRDSIMVIINGLADLTGQTGQTLTLHSLAKALLSADDIQIATSKNWTIS